MASARSNAIAVFDRDARSGRLRQQRGRPGCLSETGSGGDCADATALRGASTVAISPDGASVYVAPREPHARVFHRDRLPARSPARRSGGMPGTAGSRRLRAARALARPRRSRSAPMVRTSTSPRPAATPSPCSIAGGDRDVVRVGAGEHPVGDEADDDEVAHDVGEQQRARVLRPAERAELDDDARAPRTSAVSACRPSW